MTARVTTLKGADAGLYYVEALPSYYLDTDEPAGRWQGRGADLLGLRGEIEDADFLDVMAGIHPRSGGATLGRAYGEESVRGFDITASAPKSVSTLFALGDPFVRAEVLAAHDAAVAAMVGWVEDHAHTRYRINGQVSIVDAEGIIAATFRQHTSRALDPQLHTHVVIANRVRSPDGRWLALDARTIKLDQRTLSAIYHATLRASSPRISVSSGGGSRMASPRWPMCPTWSWRSSPPAPPTSPAGSTRSWTGSSTPSIGTPHLVSVGGSNAKP